MEVPNAPRQTQQAYIRKDKAASFHHCSAKQKMGFPLHYIFALLKQSTMQQQMLFDTSWPGAKEAIAPSNGLRLQLSRASRAHMPRPFLGIGPLPPGIGGYAVGFPCKTMFLLTHPHPGT